MSLESKKEEKESQLNNVANYFLYYFGNLLNIVLLTVT
jgi:hypothetical protein